MFLTKRITIFSIFQKYFNISAEILQTGTVFHTETQTYRYRTRGIVYDFAPTPYIPYPEVVSYIENQDGTITKFGYYCLSLSITDSSLHYNINSILQDNVLTFKSINNESINDFNLSNEDCWILGRYVADGHIRKEKRKGRIDSYHYQCILSIGNNKVNELKSLIQKWMESDRKRYKELNKS